MIRYVPTEDKIGKWLKLLEVLDCLLSILSSVVYSVGISPREAHPQKFWDIPLGHLLTAQAPPKTKKSTL